MSGNEEVVYRQDAKSAKKNIAQVTTLREPKIMSCVAIESWFSVLSPGALGVLAVKRVCHETILHEPRNHVLRCLESWVSVLLLGALGVLAVKRVSP